MMSNFYRGVLLFIGGVITAESCYVLDCPELQFYTGKRFFDSEKRRGSAEVTSRKCPSCGPDGLGECMMSNLCCAPGTGCVWGENEDTAPCQKESRFHQQCDSSAPVCNRREPRTGKQKRGVCIDEGLCCNEDGCSDDHSCAKRKGDPIVPSQTRLIKAFRYGIERANRASQYRRSQLEESNRTNRLLQPEMISVLIDDDTVYRY